MCNLPGFGGGGPTSAELGQQTQTSALSNTLNANYSAAYGDQLDTLNMLKSQISRIQSGETGTGMGGAELDARRSEIINQAAAQARNVAQAERDRAAGIGGGGTSGLARESAINRQLTEEAATGAETAKSTALNRLTAEDYAQGRVNAAQAAGGLEALAGQYGGAASRSLTGTLEAGKQAFSQDEAIRQQQMEQGSLLGGLLKTGLSAGMSFATGGLSNLGSGESLGEGTKDFFTGGLNALAG